MRGSWDVFEGKTDMCYRIGSFCMKNRDHYDIAIDEVLVSANGDARLALRTVLMQNVQLEATTRVLSGSMLPRKDLGKRKDLN